MFTSHMSFLKEKGTNGTGKLSFKEVKVTCKSSSEIVVKYQGCSLTPWDLGKVYSLGDI